MIFLIVVLLSYINSTEADDIYSRVLTDKFFRGIVADNLAEDTSFVSEIGCVRNTYSEMRVCIIDWIEKNPKKASKLFSKKIKAEGGFKINSVLYEYYINPVFKEIIDKMQDAAQKDMSIESMRSISSFLFDFNSEYSNLNVFLPHEENLSYGSKQDLSSYFRINQELLRDEVSKIDSIFYSLSNYKVKDLKDIIKKADEYHKSFSEYFSVIKNVKLLDKDNVERMFKKLEYMKKMIILKVLVIRLRVAESEIKNPDDKIFSKVVKDIVDLSESDLSLNSFVGRATKIWHEIDNVSKVFNFIRRNREVSLMLDFRYSCFLDFLFNFLDSYIVKGSYEKYRKEIVELRNYFLNVSVGESDLTNYLYNYDRSMNIINLNFKNSKKNRLIQFIIWDGFLPYDIYWLDKKKYFGFKVIEEGLFNYSYSKSIRSWNY